MRKKTNSSRTIVFILIAACLMVLIDRVFYTAFDQGQGGEAGQVAVAVQEQPVPDVQPALPDFAPPLEFSMGEPLMPVEDPVAEDIGRDEVLAEVTPDAPQWQRYAVPVTVPEGAPRVVIIIDDMGMDRVQTRAAMDLPAPITFAFLPYAGDLAVQTAMARERGHELIVHVPMEPMNATLNAGPQVLRPSMEAEEFMRVLEGGLSAFDGYVGINNHMGSRMTQDREGMRRVMEVLREKGLLYVDSKTISTSVAEDEAQKAGIPHAGRDVFLDHDESYEAVSAALAQAERKALQDGLAIAIGHPKKETLRALREWLPGLQEKGIHLIPVSAAVTVPPPMAEAPEAQPEEVTVSGD